MIGLTALLSSLALAPPAFAPPPMLRDGEAHNVRQAEPGAPVSSQRFPAPFTSIEQAMRPQAQFQVRIEQRVIIRIAPSPPAARERMLSTLPRREMETRFQEVRQDSCVSIQGIAGVAPVQPNRLLLFMRDHRVLSAALDRACDAQAFYAGFYVERSSDGMLCSERDLLKSRTGTSCEVAQFNRLVAIRD